MNVKWYWGGFNNLTFCVANVHAVDGEAEESRTVWETQAGVASGFLRNLLFGDSSLHGHNSVK